MLVLLCRLLVIIIGKVYHMILVYHYIKGYISVTGHDSNICYAPFGKF